MRLDKIDRKILVLLKDGEANLNHLWLKSFAREGQKVFRERLERLEKLNLIIMGTRKKQSVGYLIKLI